MDYGKFYDENYYETSCGEVSYLESDRWMPFYERVADKIIESMNPTTVLDVGCAVGYIVAALRDRGVEAYGIDASEFAISRVREDIKPYCRVCSALDTLPEDMPQKYDLLVTIEVAEHLYEDDSNKFIENLCKYSDNIIFSSTPSDITEKTHFNVQQLEYWSKRFARNGFFRSLTFDATFISPQAIKFEKIEANIHNIVENYERSLRIVETRLKLLSKLSIESDSRVYFNTGNGFSDEQSIKLNDVYLSGQFTVIDKKINLPQGTRAICVELAKGYVCAVKNFETVSDSGLLEWSTVNGILINEFVVFANTEPQIIIDLNGKSATWLKMKAEILCLSSAEIMTLFNNFNQIQVLSNDLLHKDRKIDELINKKNEIQELFIQTKEKVGKLIIENEAKNEEISHLAQESNIAKLRNEEMGAALWGEQQKVKSLLVSKETLDIIYHSRCYRLIMKYYAVRNFILPRGSKRFIAAKMLFNTPRYIRMGYVGKLSRHILHNGFKGLKTKIKKIVLPEPYSQVCEILKATDKGILSANNIPAISLSKIVPKHQDAVDVIICVHNAYEDVRRCIESVFEFTTEPFGIIIVDDGSAEQTRDYLKELTQNCTNIKLIRNKQGNGYTIAANMGLRASTAEYCVLLNSDTIVTDGWIDKMVYCMKSDDSVGIVGPLSNTASWQSVPKLFNKNGDWSSNPIPEGFTVEDMGRMIEKYSSKLYVKIPLLNGFCLMIKREVIDTVGYLDEQNFGKGYGEEDDYNLRAYKAGYRLAVSDDTYIFHAQSKSYSDEKRLELCRVSGQKVREKHGDELLDKCIDCVKNNYSLEGIRARAAVIHERETLIKKAKQHWEGKRILFILPIADAGGGGNVVIQEASLMIEMGVDVCLFNLLDHKQFFEASHPHCNIPVIYGEKLESFINEANNFDVVCSTLYTSVKYFKRIANRDRIKFAYYVQDFEPYFFDIDTSAYKEALSSYTLLENMILVTKTNWNRDKVKKETGAECEVIGPSVDIDLFCPRKQGGNTGKIVIAAMVRPESPRREPLLTMEVLYQAYLQNVDKVEILIFGSDPEKSQIDKAFWDGLPFEFSYTNLGKLNRAEISSLLSYADIFTDFSSFQAMGLTAMEAMSCGCAVIVPSNGGTTEYAKNNKNCLVIDSSNKQKCIDTLNMLIRDKELRDRISINALEDLVQFYPEKCAFNFLKAVFK